MEYSIRIIRSKRRSVSVSISSDNFITVRCPYNFSDSKVNAFIMQKKNWIDKIVAENNKKLAANDEVINYTQILVFGRRVPLVISCRDAITAEAVYVKNLKHIKKLFTERFLNQFSVYVEKLSNETGLCVNSVSVRSYKSRWGCCDRNKNLKFNYLLFMLSPDIQKYVIIHELCHTVHFNHSAAFWRLVAEFVPDYKKIRLELKKFDFLIGLYQ